MFKKFMTTAIITSTMLLASCNSVCALESPPIPGPSIAPVASRHTKPGSAIKALVIEVAIRNSIDPKAFVRMGQIESGLNPNAYNPASKACGLFQFLPGTAKHYKLANCRDAYANADAAAQLWNDNAAFLKKYLGRSPTAGELYLAHQQGAFGAYKLLANPTKLAVDIVGREAVLMNGGHLDMTAGEFANLWTAKFDSLQ